MKVFSFKIFFILLIISFICLFYYMDGHHYLSFEYVKKHLIEFRHYYELHPMMTIGLFLSAYLFLTALSIPGSIVLTILSGAIFGTFMGVLLVTLAGTAGATIAFLSSRYLLRDFITEKFRKQFESINHNLEKDGLLYLFILRFIPVSPFVVINLVLGLTNLRVWTFFWTTALGMIPGNWIYTYAGKRIGELETPGEIMTPSFIFLLTGLGLLPFVARKLSQLLKKKVAHV